MLRTANIFPYRSLCTLLFPHAPGHQLCSTYSNQVCQPVGFRILIFLYDSTRISHRSGFSPNCAPVGHAVINISSARVRHEPSSSVPRPHAPGPSTARACCFILRVPDTQSETENEIFIFQTRDGGEPLLDSRTDTQ